jgi:hypothetical protein
MKKDGKIIGIVYPIPPRIIENLRGKKNAVFCKMTAHESVPKKLSKNKKLFFYEAKRKKLIVGETIIKKLDLMNYFEILSNKISNLVQNEEELKNYVGARREKKLTLFFLKNIIFYEKPYKLNKNITMTGQYMTKEDVKT